MGLEQIATKIEYWDLTYASQWLFVFSLFLGVGVNLLHALRSDLIYAKQ